MLQEPLDLQDQADRTLAASLLRRLAHYLDADLQAAEPARVLRLPGTQNFKYDPPRHVVVERRRLIPSAPTPGNDICS